MRPTPDGLRLASALAGGFASIADGIHALMASQNDAPPDDQHHTKFCRELVDASD
jgi:hypothetical protein